MLVPEGKPDEIGRRIAAAELRANGIRTTVIPDSAVAHLVGSASLAGVLLPIEAVTTAGFALAPLGAWASVTIAAERQVPVFAVAPSFVVENPIGWSGGLGRATARATHWLAIGPLPWTGSASSR